MKPRQLKGFTYTQPTQDPNQYFAMLRALEEERLQRSQQERMTQPPDTRGRGGFLTSLISEGGGLAGAAGGAALGTAILPGIGTLVGAGLGGLFGGTGGRAVENKVRDDEFRIGDAVGEGLLTGALSAVGPAFQLAKGAKATKGLSSVLGGVDDAAKATRSATPAIGALENKGLGMTSKSGGYFVGAEVPGSKALTPATVKRYDQLLRKLKIGANDASDLARGVESRLQPLAQQLSDNIAKNNIAVPGKSFAKSVSGKISKTPGLTDEAVKFGNRQTSLLAKEKDAAGLLRFRRELDSFINQNANPDSALSGQQAVARIIRGEVKDKLNSLLPGFKQQNNLYHDLSEIQSFVLRAAKRSGTDSTQAGAGITGRILASPTANTIKAKAGQALQSVGRQTAGTTGSSFQPARYAKLQAPGNLAQAISTPTPPTDLGVPVGANPMGVMGAGTLDVAPPAPQGGMPQSYTLQQALGDAQQILGPDATPPQYLSYAKALMDSQPGGGSEGLNVTKPTSEKYSQALGGSQALDQLEALIAQSGVPSGTRIPGRGIETFGVGSDIRNATGTAEFDTLAFNAVDNLLRILTGAQAPESEIRRYMNQYIPAAGDSPEAVQTKLNLMRQQFQSILGLAQPGASTGADLSSLMQGAF